MKIIQLKSNGIGRYEDVSPYELLNSKLDLKIVLPNVNGEFFLITEINGTKSMYSLLDGSEVTLENLSAGELCAEVKHYLKGRLIKTYKVEPLILKEVDATLSAMPEIAALELRTTELEEAVEEQKRTLEESNELLEKERNKVAAFIKFAYADYKNNVYLGGGSVEQFLREFGFELSEEEIEAIKGVDENE